MPKRTNKPGISENIRGAMRPRGRGRGRGRGMRGMRGMRGRGRGYMMRGGYGATPYGV